MSRKLTRRELRSLMNTAIKRTLLREAAGSDVWELDPSASEARRNHLTKDVASNSRYGSKQNMSSPAMGPFWYGINSSAWWKKGGLNQLAQKWVKLADEVTVAARQAWPSDKLLVIKNKIENQTTYVAEWKQVKNVVFKTAIEKNLYMGGAKPVDIRNGVDRLVATLPGLKEYLLGLFRNVGTSPTPGPTPPTPVPPPPTPKPPLAKKSGWDRYIAKSRNKTKARAVRDGWFEMIDAGHKREGDSTAKAKSFKNWTIFYHEIRNDPATMESIGKKPGQHLKQDDIIHAYKFMLGQSDELTPGVKAPIPGHPVNEGLSRAAIYRKRYGRY